MYEFNLDMDGVLVDFDAEFQKHFPGVGEEDDWSWQELYKVCPDIYLIAPQKAGAVQLFNFVRARGTVQILTAIPRRWNWPMCKEHKAEWANRELGIVNKDVKFGPYAQDKQTHCKGPNSVLIDDKILNIEQWRAKGGIGVCHTSVEDTIAQLATYGIV